MAFLAGIGKWILTTLISWVVEKFVPLVKRWIEDFFAKRKRAKEQAEAKKKLDEDIKNGAPRSEETRQNESDWLNKS